jgi:predicted DsbA family dithiol-disulfide isomerase
MMTLSTICYIATPRASLGIRDGGRPISALPWGLIPMVIIGLYAKFGGGSPIQEPVPDLSTVKYTKASLSALEKSSRALGPLKAPVSIVEFADLLCPACRSMHQSLLKFVARNKGKVRLLYHHFPLSKEKGHEDSQYAATLAEQFNDEDFWGFVSKVYESEEKPTRLDLDNIAAKFYGKKIRSMVQAGEAVVKEIKMGQDLGVTLTPTYIIFINRKPESVASSFNIKDVITQDKYVKIFNPSPKKKSTSSKGK